ncbi:hypothetical protein DM01DRAFT_1373000 [Hesseltinella vesiculosa]|uniref:Uncharacterized protein n=1 Tax=Hesseltinella vesiculosa TaxID=101127 RepID=A0A1X2GM94_9FUNG|nr:hypothetical protein DM01DRAFT_1373000 [Hesseltinella vesiculosa]
MTQFTFRYIQPDGQTLNENGEDVDEENEEEIEFMEVESLTNYNKYISTNRPNENASMEDDDQPTLKIKDDDRRMPTKSQPSKGNRYPYHTAQRWCKRWTETGEIELETSSQRRGPKPALGSEHKAFVTNLIDEQPLLRVADVVDALCGHFNGLTNDHPSRDAKCTGNNRETAIVGKNLP